MKEFQFWSESETKALITAIEKFQSISKAATWLAPKINRERINVYQKGICLSKKGFVNVTIKSHKTEKQPAKINPVELPKGFSFDFTPNRAEMFKDHVRLYF
jgi:hypothetical protein